jgi:hypothetical protein
MQIMAPGRPDKKQTESTCSISTSDRVDMHDVELAEIAKGQPQVTAR